MTMRPFHIFTPSSLRSSSQSQFSLHGIRPTSRLFRPLNHRNHSIAATMPSQNGSSHEQHAFGTLAVHAGAPHDPHTGAVIPPISLSTTYVQHAPGKPIGAYEYTRSQNPNREQFETAVATLEHAAHALAYSSGSAATANVLQSLGQDAHVVSVSDVYGGTHRYFTKVAHAHNVKVDFTPDILNDLPHLLKENTKLVWIETPSNPTLSLTDIAAVAEIAHRHGAKVLVDNTFMSPYLQTPLDHGADLVLHSVTKYINGHSDVLMGVVAVNDEESYQKLLFLQNAIGAVPSAFDSWLAHRGLKTLHLRSRAASENAAKIAAALEASPLVVSVNYPGLASHKQRKVAVKQHRDGLGGGMLSFRVKGDRETASRVTIATKIFALAESLGGIESLVEVPAIMTHAGIPKEDREKSGVYDDLVRVSCGIEDGDDLVRDLLQALDVAVKGNGTNGASNGTNGTN